MASQEATAPRPAPRTWRVDFILAIAVGAAALIALVASGRDFGMVWDEGYTVVRERGLASWFSMVVDPPSPGARAYAFGPRMLDRCWRFSREEPDGHPPFYALLGLAGWRLTHHWLAALQAYRFGPMALTALTASLIFGSLSQHRGRWTGLMASALLLLMPRVFAHAHYAHYDMPMTCLWLLAQAGFIASLDDRRWAIPFGLALGLSAGTKFTGLFAVVPPVAWVALVEVLPRMGRRNARAPAPRAWPGLRSLVIALPVAALALYAIQPPWWFQPLSGPWRFVVSNLTRERTQPLPNLYFGRIYEFSLPWHNTLVWTAITTPVLVQGLAAIGIASVLARVRREPWALIWPLSWATLMVVRALPNAPGHDGIRLFLPSVASLAVLAALGLSRLAEGPRARRGLALVVAAATVGECLIGIGRTYPYTDSYYNIAIGGLKGAEQRGFELTYYWETTGPEFLAWVRRELRKGPVGLNFTMDSTNHNLLREWGEIPPGVEILIPDHPERPDYVQQRRKALYYPLDWWLERHGAPRFTIQREGVDLLRVYPFEQWLDAARQTRNIPLPDHLEKAREALPTR